MIRPPESEVRVVAVPAWSAETLTIDGNPINQVLIRAQTARIASGSSGNEIELETGDRAQVVSRKPDPAEAGISLLLGKATYDAAIASGDLSSGRWLGARERTKPAEVLASLTDAFSFRAADQAAGREGLRPPQLGAVYAVLAHWTTNSTEPATVVMPTGTGKTETMLALLCSHRLVRLLVIVPSDALRSQTARKFEELGVLQSAGVVSATALRPIVGQVKHGFSNEAAAQSFVDACNVVVATPSSLQASTPDIRHAILERFSCLFVDEAHHVAAATWHAIRDGFASRPVVQFTATPFRLDGRPLGGRVVYAFPLGEAQRQGYFSTINFRSVLDLGDHDGAVARRSIERLRADLAQGFDHVLMARVNTISRGLEVLPIYEGLAPDLGPVLLHSNDTVAHQRAAVEAVRARRSRIIVCVNMLGEGFDLPALKVAAIHDTHKSLGVTLQFVGRFARAGLGEATVVVGRPGGDVDPSLRRLYGEDADWNKIIRDLSESAVGDVAGVSDFESRFGSLPPEVPIRSLLPKMSTVVYRAEFENWDIGGASDLFPENQLLTVPMAINESDRVAWFVVESRTPVAWGQLEAAEEVVYHLYVLHFDETRKLLFINSSNTDSHHEDLAHAVSGPNSTRITGEGVYRVMHGVARLVPTTVGLLDIRSRNRRFSMLYGANVSEGFPLTEAQTKTKTNIFAFGYEGGERVSIGASLKGRVWSYRIASSLKQWVDWCHHVGTKLIDETISVDQVMLNFIRPEEVVTRPDLVPLALEWTWDVASGTSEQVRLEVDGSGIPLIDADLEILDHDRVGPISFRVVCGGASATYTLTLGNGQMDFVARSTEAEVVTRDKRTPLSQFLNQRGVYVHMEHEAIIIPPALLLRPPRDLAPFDTAGLEVLDWSGIDLTVESQGIMRNPASIQARMIAFTTSLADWDLVLDDDGTGEIADIVAMRADGDRLVVQLTHCKYVLGGIPRAQVEDLYVVCGQAQKSARWGQSIPALIQRLRDRERRRLRSGRPTGFMRGDVRSLDSIADRAHLLRPEFSFAIAQPGLSKAIVSRPQLDLLAATETFLRETLNGPLRVYCSG